MSKFIVPRELWSCGCRFKCVNFKLNSEVNTLNIQVNITREWMPGNQYQSNTHKSSNEIIYEKRNRALVSKIYGKTEYS